MADYANSVQSYTITPVQADDVSVIRIEAAVSSMAAIDPARMSITLTHAIAGVLTAMVGGVWQAGFAGTVTPNGRGFDYAITAHPDLAAGLWTVTVEAYSLGSVRLSSSWTFTTVAPPVPVWIGPSGPTVYPDASLEFTLSDADGTIAPAGTELFLVDPQGSTHHAIAAGAVQAGWTGSCGASGGSITRDYGMLVGSWSYSLTCEDDAGLTTTITGSWSTIPSPLPSYLRMLEFVLPPWLLRTEGIRLVGALAAVIDDHRSRLVAGVKLRFPGVYTLEGVDKIGRERRLRRGPAESAATFAARLPRWWQDHRTRGGAYALLEQMKAYLDGTLDPPYDVVSYRGVRHVMNADDEITRDAITWGTDETGYWSRVWVFLYTTAATIDASTLEAYAAIVRDWLPAHIVGELVVIHPSTRLWDYPQPVPDWDDSWDWSDGPTVEEL